MHSHQRHKEPLLRPKLAVNYLFEQDKKLTRILEKAPSEQIQKVDYFYDSTEKYLIGCIIHKHDQSALSIQGLSLSSQMYGIEYYKNYEQSELSPIRIPILKLKQIPKSMHLYHAESTQLWLLVEDFLSSSTLNEKDTHPEKVKHHYHQKVKNYL